MTKEEFENLEVGKTFNVGYITLRVEEDCGLECENCFFDNFFENIFLRCGELPNELMPNCSGGKRKDGKSVIFKEVENDNNRKY